MGMRPFYRSRLFWLGVPGLVFLQWVWWDSFSVSTWACTQVSVGMDISYIDLHLGVVRGGVVIERWRLADVPQGATWRACPPIYGRTKSVLALKPEDEGLWRWETTKMNRPVNQSSLAPMEGTWFRFSFGFVVAGYVAIWAGAMALYRRWMRRRWKAAMVAGG